jgi:chorismate--pyruvate lyase
MFHDNEKNIDSRLLSWLTYEHSLTERLNKNLKKPARLELLSQRWLSATWWDNYVLKIKKESVLHRDIIMWADEACWYARTILPVSTYHVLPSFFDRLQNESLGQLIFNDPMIKRVEMIYYSVNKSSLEYYWLKKALVDVEIFEEEYWLRFSSFVVNDLSPFFLIEIVLPGLMRSVV